MTFRYCPRCATELELRASSGPDPDRPTCPNCGWVHYENPTPTVQAWIDRDGSYLALRRGEEPLKGKWNMPGGFVEVGERGDEAITREVSEETGLDIEVVELIGIFDSTYGDGDDAKPIFDVAYRCRIVGRRGRARGLRRVERGGVVPARRVPRAGVRRRAEGARAPARDGRLEPN